MLNKIIESQASSTSSISNTELQKIVQPIIDFCETVVPVLLGVVVAIGAIWIILLCVKFSRADEPQEHDKAKKAIRNAVIGFILIFVLLIMLRVGANILETWWSDYNY